jgi:hypothetical protein
VEERRIEGKETVTPDELMENLRFKSFDRHNRPGYIVVFLRLFT